jgi:hypothetical protein
VREELEMKHRIVHTLQKYVLNPPIKLALAVGLPLPGYALLETKGRKTGKPRRTPAGDGRIGNVFWLATAKLSDGSTADYTNAVATELVPRLIGWVVNGINEWVSEHAAV